MDVKKLYVYTPIEIVSAYKNQIVKENGSVSSKSVDVVRTKIITDGKIDTYGGLKTETKMHIQIDDAFVYADTIDIERFYFGNCTFLIRYVVVEGEIKERYIYLDNPKDKVALRGVKKITSLIEKHATDLNFGSVYEALTQKNSGSRLSLINRNIYTYRKNP